MDYDPVVLTHAQALAVLLFIPDADDPYQAATRLMKAMPLPLLLPHRPRP